MKKPTAFYTLVVTLVVLLLSACGPGPGPTPTPTAVHPTPKPGYVCVTQTFTEDLALKNITFKKILTGMVTCGSQSNTILTIMVAYTLRPDLANQGWSLPLPDTQIASYPVQTKTRTFKSSLPVMAPNGQSFEMEEEIPSGSRAFQGPAFLCGVNNQPPCFSGLNPA